MIQEMGYEARPIPGRQRTSVGLIGNDGQVEPNLFQSLPGVLEVIPVSHSYKQVSREWKEENTVVTLPTGPRSEDREIVLMAGPCAVESEEQILGIARMPGGDGRHRPPGRGLQTQDLSLFLPGARRQRARAIWQKPGTRPGWPS